MVWERDNKRREFLKLAAFGLALLSKRAADAIARPFVALLVFLFVFCGRSYGNLSWHITRPVQRLYSFPQGFLLLRRALIRRYV